MKKSVLTEGAGKRLISWLKSRLGSRSGESIAESLIALLVSSIGLLMLAGMLNGSTMMIVRSRKTVGSYYAGNNKLEEKAGDPSGTVNMVFKDEEGKIREEAFPVIYYVNRTVGKRPVISYRPEIQGEQP